MPIVDDEAADRAIAEARERIRRNFPRVHAPLNWRRVSKNTLSAVGHGKTYYVDRSGEGDATRYRARIHPQTVLGDRLMTAEQAKDLCERDASPLDLSGAPAAAPPAPPARIDPEPAAAAAALPPQKDRPDWLKDGGEVLFDDLEDGSWQR